MRPITLTVNAEELAILAELRARLRLESDADLIRVALWVYAREQGLDVPPKTFAVQGEHKRRRSTRNTMTTAGTPKETHET